MGTEITYHEDGMLSASPLSNSELYERKSKLI